MATEMARSGRKTQTSPPIFWLIFTGIAVGAVIGAFAATLIGTYPSGRFLLFLTGSATAAALAVILFLGRRRMQLAQLSAIQAPPFKEIVDSAGPMVLVAGLDGRFIYVNPASEKLLGYHASELVGMPHAGLIFAPDQAEHLVFEMMKLGASHGSVPPPAPRLKAFMDCLRSLLPSQTPSFDVELQRKDGRNIPVTLHLSAVRGETGEVEAVLAIALDRSAVIRQEQVLRESQERYRDLFENSSEMIATLSADGQFLYANPGWKRCFGIDPNSMMKQRSFADVFGSNCRGEVRTLFRRASEGEPIERVLIRNRTDDGRAQDLELSLSRRQKAGIPFAVRCLMRDVTQQKQRENRLALQLVVSQVTSENLEPDVAARRILEALCVAKEWDTAVFWALNPEGLRLEFCSGWAAPGQQNQSFIERSMGQTFARGVGLPGRIWQEERPVWITDLTSAPLDSRTEFAIGYQMVSGWAVPVRSGDKLLGVFEFYCGFRLREDRDAMATLETTASSLGQMLDRNRERGRADELSRQQEVLLDSVADGICGVDRRGLVRFANPAAARLLGTAATSLGGKAVHDLLHGTAESSSCGKNCPLRQALGHRISSTGEGTILRPDGSSFPVEYFLAPIVDQGRFSGSVLSFRDISQRYALDRLKDEFVSTVSHELRTPLTAIRGALGLLSSGIMGTVNEKAANLLRIALSNSDRLVRLINDILDLERIQSGREPLTFHAVPLEELVGQAIDGMQPVADAAGVQLIHDEANVQVAADPDRILQVLTNLLSNVIKFSPADSTVSVILHPDAGGVTLSVIDQGRGIPVDKLETIFGRFQQVDASDSRQKGGSGLGLAICRTIVLQHSGRIWAERNPVRGSTFRVFLPYQPAAAKPDGHENEEDHRTILLADAQRKTRGVVAAQLAHHGYRVLETSTVEETVAAVHPGVEAILVDTCLDGVNGWQLLPQLKKLNPAAKTPMVLLHVAGPEEPEKLPTEDGGPAVSCASASSLQELARGLSLPGEKARVLVVEDDADLARIICSLFINETVEVELARTPQDAQNACFTFQPNLLVLDLGLPDSDGFNIVDWLRQQGTLASLPMVVHCGGDLTASERSRIALAPAHFLFNAGVQPHQLEALVLTMLHMPQKEEAVVSTDAPAATVYISA